MDLEHRTVRVNNIRLHYVAAGEGPPLVLLHGFPQTWFMWRRVLPALSEHFSVYVPDLRGYGDSDKPRSDFDKRTMARDIHELVRSLGHERIALAGHDRGARVAYRYAFEYPREVSHLVLMDIVPTGVVFENTNADVARGNWHWFLFQLPDLPERLIGADPRGYLEWAFRNGSFNPRAIDVEAVNEYLRAFTLPGTIRCTLEDYRAGATTDREMDRADADAGRRLEPPTLVLWGADGGLPRLWPVMDIWRKWAKDVRGEAIDRCGHYLPEEQPEAVAEKMLAFLSTA